jgi:predicted AlkP superfamily phosphohydrolase/phosphomutase
VLFAASLDSVSLPWLDSLIASNELPNLRALTQRGTVVPVEAVRLAGLAYPSFYSGLPPADVGIYFPYQWSPERQQVRDWHELPAPPSLFQRLDRAGVRTVVLDPPECRPEVLRNGVMVSGWQFHSRILLHRWSTPTGELRNLAARFGAPERADEVFGRPTPRVLLEMLRVLRKAPERLLQAAEHYLATSADLLWVNCCALHLAGHQFFDLGLLNRDEVSASDWRQLESALLDLAKAYDHVLGRIVERLPAGSTILVFYAKGMGPTADWADLLPEMLRRILGEPPVANSAASARDLLPRGLREWIADAIPDRTALWITARLSTPQADWPRTRAFPLVSDGPGYIRFNIEGREKLGCVPRSAAPDLFAQIEEGLRTFTDFDGEPCVAEVLRPVDLLGEGTKLDWYPDQLVFWKRKSTLHGKGVRSPRYGELRRRGVGTGRSGNHFEGALAIAVEGRNRIQPIHRNLWPQDIPTTILSALGLPHGDLPGHALLAPTE